MFLHDSAKYLVLFLVFIPSCFSCSLNYANAKTEKSKAPDLLFENLRMTKMEKNSVKAQVTAKKLEQYSRDDSSFAEGIEFTLYNEQQQMNVRGKCGLLSMDSKNEIYTMFDDIVLASYEQGMKIKAAGLKWNNKTEQLTAPVSGDVMITNNIFIPEGAATPSSKSTTGMTFTGQGFSASGVSQSYSFAKNMTGFVNTEGKKMPDTDEDFDFVQNEIEAGKAEKNAENN